MNARLKIPAFAEFFPQQILSLVLIFFMGLSIYAHILHAPAQIDDHDLLFGNPIIKDIPELGKQWFTLQDHQKSLTLLTFAVNYYFSKENTFGYHLVNVLLHIMTAIFLFYFIRALGSATDLLKSLSLKEKNSFALLAALIFLVHPLQTQSVTYLWERSEVLSGFFYMVALWSYLNGRLQGKKVFYGLTVLLYIIGFFAKGTIVTLPLMIFLIEISFFQFESVKETPRRFWFHLAIISLCAILPIARFLNSIWHMEIRPIYLLTEMRVMWKYIGLAFLPIHQRIDYDIAWSRSLWEPTTFFSFLGLVVLGAVIFFSFQRHRLMVFGILWFFIYLLPTSLIFREPMWEHRLYFSMAGFAIFLAAGIFTAITDQRIRTIVAVSIVLTLCGLTIARNFLWRSPVLLLEDTITKSPHLVRPHLMLGDLYLREGNNDKALEQYQIVINLDPDHSGAYNNIGLIYIKNGDLDQAKSYFEKAIAFKQDFETPYLNLAHIVLSQTGDHQEAKKLIRKSLLCRETFWGYLQLGNLYFSEKNLEGARWAFTKALALGQNNAVAFYSLGTVYYYQNDYKNALEMYNKTINLDKSFPDSYYNIGRIYYLTKELDLSRQWLEKAFHRGPTRLDICQSLVQVSEDLNDPQKAQDYRHQCQLLSAGSSNNF